MVHADLKPDNILIEFDEELNKIINLKVIPKALLIFIVISYRSLISDQHLYWLIIDLMRLKIKENSLWAHLNTYHLKYKHIWVGDSLNKITLSLTISLTYHIYLIYGVWALFV